MYRIVGVIIAMISITLSLKVNAAGGSGARLYFSATITTITGKRIEGLLLAAV